MAEIPAYHCTAPPRVSRLRKKVKVQFRTPNRRRNEGGTCTLLTNCKESKVDDYMLRQPNIDVKKRESLVELLLDMSDCYKIHNRIAFAAVDISDRFLSSAQAVVSMEDLNYLGAAAMHIARKYHETRIYDPLLLDELIKYANGGLPDRDCLHRQRTRILEKRILDELGWKLEVRTVHTFLTWFLIEAAVNPPDDTTEDIAYFYARLGIRNYQLMITYPPKMLAAAALYAACAYTCNINMWRETLRDHTGFQDKQLFACSKRMLELHLVGHDHYEDCSWWIPFK